MITKMPLLLVLNPSYWLFGCGGFPCNTGARAVGRPTALMISAMGCSYFGYRRFTGLGQWLRMDDGSLQFGSGQRLPVGCNMRQSTLPSRTLCQVEAWSLPMSGDFYIILANTRPPALLALLITCYSSAGRRDLSIQPYCNPLGYCCPLL